MFRASWITDRAFTPTVKVAPPRLDAHKPQTKITWIRPCNHYGPCELNALHRDIYLAVLVRH